MKRFFCILVLGAIVFASCQREEVFVDRPSDVKSDVLVVDTKTRSYDEALAIAEDALKLLEGDETRSTNKRVIKRSEGQTVMRPVTRGSETEEEPIMYVFNNEDNQGFTVVAADRSKDPLIAVTELGNYTYGEPTEVEAFDAYMDGVVERLAIAVPGGPLLPTPGALVDTIRYERTEVGPLLTTKWGQQGVYAIEAGVPVAGCGPIAIAQLVAYHRYPNTLQLTYKPTPISIMLNWDDILTHTSGQGVQTGMFVWEYACDCGCDYLKMAQLIREIGERGNVSYIMDKNGIDIYMNSDDIQQALRRMGYNVYKFTPIIDIQSYKYDMLEDIQQERPVILMGQDATRDQGHIWVADGYIYYDAEYDYYILNTDYNPPFSLLDPMYIYGWTDTYHLEVVHFNWGWDGRCDGWYNLDHFETDNAYMYDDINVDNNVDTDFKYSIQLFYSIYPNSN